MTQISTPLNVVNIYQELLTNKSLYKKLLMQSYGDALFFQVSFCHEKYRNYSIES